MNNLEEVFVEICVLVLPRDNIEHRQVVECLGLLLQQARGVLLLWWRLVLGMEQDCARDVCLAGPGNQVQSRHKEEFCPGVPCIGWCCVAAKQLRPGS